MFEPENELGVIVLFAQRCEDAGFEIISIHSEFPDAIVKRNDQIYRAEFEYQASNFNLHGHDPRKADVIICWEKDCDNVLPIIALAEPDYDREITLPTRAEREAAYWKQRALKAEREVKSVKRKMEEGNGNGQQDEKPKIFGCPYCDTMFGSKQAVSAHLRFCDAYQAAQPPQQEQKE